MQPLVLKTGIATYTQYIDIVDDTPVLHREDGPALITDAKNGMETHEYWQNGELFRENNLPTNVMFHNGVLYMERYKTSNGFHRENGPAVIKYYSTGKIISTEYHINGVQCQKEDAQIYALNNLLLTSGMKVEKTHDDGGRYNVFLLIEPGHKTKQFDKFNNLKTAIMHRLDS